MLNKILNRLVNMLKNNVYGIMASLFVMFAGGRVIKLLFIALIVYAIYYGVYHDGTI